jgi:hypothetical protein
LRVIYSFSRFSKRTAFGLVLVFVCERVGAEDRSLGILVLARFSSSEVDKEGLGLGFVKANFDFGLEAATLDSKSLICYPSASLNVNQDNKTTYCLIGSLVIGG